ncbi:hypothetical protein V5799_006039 [Amblyomma americanum]|uniref:Uncharacterized protein n=1 Tax=Amblyomma americanum TaxID=6943 RepID=A0AAQ4DXJ0_AMBAM
MSRHGSRRCQARQKAWPQFRRSAGHHGREASSPATAAVQSRKLRGRIVGWPAAVAAVAAAAALRRQCPLGEEIGGPPRPGQRCRARIYFVHPRRETRGRPGATSAGRFT